MAHIPNIPKGVMLPYRLVPAKPIPERPLVEQSLQMLINVNGVFHLARYPVGFVNRQEGATGQLLPQRVAVLTIDDQSTVVAQLADVPKSYLVIQLPVVPAGNEDGLVDFKNSCDSVVAGSDGYANAREALKYLFP